MKRRIGMLVGALVLSAFVSGARADDATVRKELDAQYAKYTQGLVKKDLKMIFALVTPDATFKEANGQVQKREQLQKMMKEIMAIMTLSTASHKIEKLTVKGDTAIAEVAGKSAGKMKGQDGKSHSISYASKTRDYWVKTAGAWKIKKMEAISESMLMDGKPVTQPGKSGE